MASVLTAVLQYHLAWVSTVMPAGAAPSRAYLDKHSSKTVSYFIWIVLFVTTVYLIIYFHWDFKTKYSSKECLYKHTPIWHFDKLLLEVSLHGIVVHPSWDEYSKTRLKVLFTFHAEWPLVAVLYAPLIGVKRVSFMLTFSYFLCHFVNSWIFLLSRILTIHCGHSWGKIILNTDFLANVTGFC